MKIIAILSIAIVLASCSAQRQATVDHVTRLHLLDTARLPHKLMFQGTTVGGLSDIDYDRKTGLYYMISDDRSAFNPARFYTVRIGISEKGIDTVQVVGVTTLLRADGNPYPNSKQDPQHTPDPESMRYNPLKKQLVWGSEGERIVRKDAIVLEDPSINIIDGQGHWLDSFPLPSNMHMQATENGPRQNGVFEGLTFMNNYRKLLVNVEEPIYEDGPRAGTGDSSAWIRMLRYDVKTRRPEGQFAYRIDPVAHPANPPGAFKINGVPDILAINDHQLIVIERSFSTGHRACTIKLYLAELATAEDVTQLRSLSGPAVHAISKKLLLNMDELGMYIDNVEGITLGPRLPNGHQSLILAADDNFDPSEISQFFLFEIE